MDTIAFDLKLMDSVSAPARRAAEAMAKLEAKAKKAQDALELKHRNDLGKQFEKVGFAAARAAKKQHDAFANSWAKIGMAAQRANERAHKEAERLAEKQKEHGLLGGIKEGLGFGKFASAAFLGSMLAEGAFKIGETILEAAHKFGEVVFDTMKDAFRAAGNEQTQRITERNVLGVEGSRGFREDIESFAKKTPFDDDQIRQMMLPLRRAGLSQAASRQVFATATDIGGSDANAVGSAIEQFKGIYTRRGVSKKQLMELLGNVGSSIPDFYKELGKKLAVSPKEAESRAEQGGLDPQLIMNMITEAKNKQQGGAAGTGGNRFAESFNVRLAKIGQLPEEYYKRLVDSPAFSRISDAAGRILDRLDPDSSSGKRIMAALERMFDQIVAWFDELTSPEGIDNLVKGVETAVDFLEKGVAMATAIVDLFKQAADIGATLTGPAQFFMNLYDKVHPSSGNDQLDKLADMYNKKQIDAAGLSNVVSSMSPAQRDEMMKRYHITVNNHNTFNGIDENSAQKIGDATHRSTQQAAERAVHG